MAALDTSDLVAKLQAHFERAGAVLETDPDFHERYGIDFTVTRIQGVHTHVNLGVHVTTASDDLDGLERFERAASRGVVLKAIYIELSEETVEAGGVLVAYAACLSLLFDRELERHRAIGMRVHPDCSFRQFQLGDAISRLQRVADNAEMRIGEDLEGRIIAYFTEKGFGFIQTDDEAKYFFHIANIVDDDLRGRLPDYVPGETIPVLFQFGGSDGKKYPKALNVSLVDN